MVRKGGVSQDRLPTGACRDLRRKRLAIDQSKLDRAKEALGVSSDAEVVDQALDLVLFRDELVQGVERFEGTGGVENYFPDAFFSSAHRP